MTYIENVFLCLATPLILSLFFSSGRARRFTLFMTVGMTVCLLSAYASSAAISARQSKSRRPAQPACRKPATAAAARSGIRCLQASSA